MEVLVGRWEKRRCLNSRQHRSIITAPWHHVNAAITTNMAPRVLQHMLQGTASPGLKCTRASNSQSSCGMLHPEQ
jgi:hypothetical protein